MLRTTLALCLLMSVAVGQSEVFETTIAKAKAGDAESQFILGNMYDRGRGVPKDEKEAVKWYRKAAEQGYAKAQHQLGVMYDKGEGVPEDDVAAYAWFNIAAGNGEKNARESKEQITKQMTPQQIAEGQASHASSTSR